MISKKEERNHIKRLQKKGIGVSRTEDKLADELRKKKVPYQRQVKVGIYRVDFLISPSIVIDIKGPHHDGLTQSVWDMKRKAFLERRGLRVYEFSASEVYESPGKYAELIARECMRSREQESGTTR